jgi:hypothetical protein
MPTCLLIVACAPALAQDDVLRGPPVKDADAKTLVGHGMTGEFQRIQGRPEAAAIQLLDLDETMLARAQGVIDTRSMRVAMLLIDEIDTVRDMTDEMRAGHAEQARALLDRIHRACDPDLARDPLVAPLDEVLDDARQARLQALLDEYWSAWVDWEMRSMADAERTPDARRAVESRLAFQVFQEEVRDGYEVSLRRYHDAIVAINDAIDPTPEQREAIRAIVIEHVKRTRLHATPSQRRQAMRAVYDMLDDRRKGLLFDYLLERVLPDE